MFNALDQSDIAHADELPESTSYFGRSFGEKLEDAIRLDEARQAALDNGALDFWKPVDDWMLD